MEIQNSIEVARGKGNPKEVAGSEGGKKADGSQESPEAAFLKLLAQLLGGAGVAAVTPEIPVVKISSPEPRARKEEREAPQEEAVKAKDDTESEQVAVKEDTADQRETDESVESADIQVEAAAAAVAPVATETVVEEAPIAEAAKTTPQQMQKEIVTQIAKAQTTTKLTQEEQAVVQQQLKARPQMEFDNAPTTAAQVSDQALETVKSDAVMPTASAGKDMRSDRGKVTAATALEFQLAGGDSVENRMQQIASEKGATTTPATPLPNRTIALTPGSVLAASAGQSSGEGSLFGKGPSNFGDNGVRSLGMGIDLNQSRAADAGKGSAATQRLPGAAQNRIIEKIKQIADEMTLNKAANTVTVKLDPAELGEMTVKVTRRGDQLFARIIPESPEVEENLKGRTPEILTALSGIGVRPENIHIAVGKEPSESDVFMFQNFFGSGSRGDEGAKESKQDTGSLRYERPDFEGGVPLGNPAQVAGDAGWVA